LQARAFSPVSCRPSHFRVEAVPFIRRTIIVALLLLSAASPVWAQTQEKTKEKLQDKATLVREAFASPYGKALTAELGKSLRASADPACLTEKGLAADQLEPRGRDIVVTWGTRLVEGVLAPVERQVAADPFAGAAELDHLKSNPDVKRYLAMEGPRQQAKLLDMIFENFDRYNLVNRVKLRAVYPLGTGNEELLRLNPIDATEAAMDKFVESNRSKVLKRFLQLSEQKDAAAAAAIQKNRAPPMVPHTLFNGVENDLAELCIRSGK
jgi:hypothetical protein